MTAVAPDDDGQNSPFPDNDRLMAAAMRVFAPLASEMAERRDAQKQRPYVEFYQVPLSVRKNAAEELARELGLETIEEQAREEGREIYHALGGAVNDWEDAIYQGDGMWLTDDGDWVQR
ncbi:hypothetical protein [Aliiruegeria sabulilitoris]|uniref:hypothetical protein n=1 Tax=Aliiruegeria sabulilitoris TaxID=1510458 RepID=UPI0012E38446|nr:hypothetical protein [Aliiruegeria sabulilitoris]NDR55347.1 hypothetical protein [Pseudoruegeria sp. M32A2M]